MGKMFNPFYRIIATMQEQHLCYRNQLSALFKMCSDTANIQARSSLFRLHKNCRDIYTEMDKEMVNCRRAGRVTLKYTELQAKYIEAITTFEQWTVMAALMF